ncbi:hypothetical protein MKW98_022377, partial [Papaver atlanticum]
MSAIGSSPQIRVSRILDADKNKKRLPTPAIYLSQGPSRTHFISTSCLNKEGYGCSTAELKDGGGKGLWLEQGKAQRYGCNCSWSEKKVNAIDCTTPSLGPSKLPGQSRAQPCAVTKFVRPALPQHRRSTENVEGITSYHFKDRFLKVQTNSSLSRWKLEMMLV